MKKDLLKTDTKLLRMPKRAIMTVGACGFWLAFAALCDTGCATPLFALVQDAKGTAQVACGLDPNDDAAIVVAVFSKTAVDDGWFVVTPIMPPGAKAPILRSSERRSVYVPGGKPVCVRLPLPPTTMAIRRFSVSFSGTYDHHRVSGGALNCEPQPVTHWSCEWE